MSRLFDAGTLKYEIYRVLRESDDPLTAEVIAGRIGVSGLAVASTLKHDLRPSGFVKEDNLYRWSLVRAEEAVRAQDLDDPLLIAQAEVEALKKRLGELQWQLEQAERALERYRAPRGVKALYAEVGLAPDCEDHVFQAVRRSHRQRYHPDRFPPKEKKAAHERFVELERVFDELAKLRRKAKSGRKT